MLHAPLGAIALLFAVSLLAPLPVTGLSGAALVAMGDGAVSDGVVDDGGWAGQYLQFAFAD